MPSSCSNLRYLLSKLVHAYLLVNVSTAQRGINTCALISPLSPSLFFTHDPQIHAPHLTVSSPSLIKRLVLEQLALSFCLALVVNRVYLSQRSRATLVRYSYSKRNMQRRKRIRFSKNITGWIEGSKDMYDMNKTCPSGIFYCMCVCR